MEMSSPNFITFIFNSVKNYVFAIPCCLQEGSNCSCALFTTRSDHLTFLSLKLTLYSSLFLKTFAFNDDYLHD